MKKNEKIYAIIVLAAAIGFGFYYYNKKNKKEQNKKQSGRNLDKKQEFVYFGNIDVSGFKKIIENSNLDWDENDFRQKKFDAHKETQSIPIIFSEQQYNSFNGESQDEIKKQIEDAKTKYYKIFEDELHKVNQYLSKKIGKEGYLFRAMLVNLPKGKDVKPHLDKGKSFFVPQRIHIPIITNEKCYFTVGDITKKMKEGELWEINNNGIIHSVSNKGEQDRIHLIIDWVKK